MTLKEAAAAVRESMTESGRWADDDTGRLLTLIESTDSVLVPRATLERWIRAEPLTAELADEMSALLNPNPKGSP